MKTAFRSVLLVATILAQLSAQAQFESRRIIKKYSVKEGLSQAVVNSITQDEKGLMWFATDDGLNRFNGYSFMTFKYDAMDSHKHDNFVQRVFKDSEGELWFSSRGGLYKFDLSSLRLTAYLDTLVGGRNDVSCIAEGIAGNLWVGWYWAGLASFDKDKEEFTAYDNNNLPSLSSTATIALLEDSFGLLWVGTQDKGLDVFKISGAQVPEKREDLVTKDILPSLYVKCFEEDHLGNIWIGTTKGLVLYIRRENKFHVFDQPEIVGKGIFALNEDSDKNLWIGSQGAGLYTISLKNFDTRNLSQFNFHHVDILGKHNVSQHTIRSIFEDRDKNIWIGTHGDGVYMIGNEEEKFINFQSRKFLRSAESYVSYYGLTNDKDGFIWAGTDGDGIFKLNTRGDILHHYEADGKRGSLPDDVIVSAYMDHDDNLWFGTYSHGLLLYDSRGDEFIPFTHAPSDISVPLANQVRMIFEDSKKNIWVGATRGGLCLVDKAKKVYRQHPGNKILTNVDVRAMVEDKEGGLWVGCYGNGLSYYKHETDEWTPYFVPDSSGAGLHSSVVYALAMDKKSRLWIGSGGGGLGVYNTLTKKLKRYTENDGLINNTIYGLMIDEQEKIWVSTIKGISKFDPETEQFYNYTSVDGLQEGQFNPGSFLNHINGSYMCFGGAQGLNLFRPLQVSNDAKVPTVMISGFRLFNKPVEVSAVKNGDNVLDKVIDETDKITLKHDQSVFTFEFFALNYNYPEKTKYAYKLEGLDHEWSYVGRQRLATYRYLSPGTYEFKVKAANQDNIWPEEYTSIKLAILPPFWKTPQAYLLYFFIIGAMAYGVIIVRKKQDFLRKRLKIEKEQRKRERQLVQEKLSFFTEVSHEFRTPLTLMIGPLEEILTREGSFTPVGRKLKMVYKNAHKLLNLISQLLDYRKVETGNMLLKVKEDDIVAFVEEIFVTFRELAIRKNIHFEFYAEQPSLMTWFDKEKIEIVLNNILSNSFKYIGNGDSISITVKKHQTSGAGDDFVLIEIRDNGMGIPKDQMRYIFDWFYRGAHTSPVSTGIGLALAKKLIYLHKGLITAESAEGKGSVFTIKVPLGNDHFEPHEILFDKDNDNLLHHSPHSLYDEDDDPIDNSHKKGLRNVLIVEDDNDVRSFLKDYFETDYKILEAGNGKEGLSKAEEHCIDLIISDVMMPEMNGIDFCKAIKNNLKTSHIPVVLLTAKTSFSHHKEGLEIGADAYVTKPFSPEMLSLTMSNLLKSGENLKRFHLNLFVSNGTAKKERVSPDEKLLGRIYELLKANLDRPDFNLDGFCEELNMGRSLFYKKIKTLTGLSPVEYVRFLRLTEAASLLKTQKYKVFEVVYMTGFSDLKYFRQNFIKVFGYPPSKLIEK